MKDKLGVRNQTEIQTRRLPVLVMSFPRSRIPVRFLRVLLSINPSAYQQSKGLSCEGISNTQFCYSSWRLLPIAQGILALLGFGQDTFFWTITKLEEQCLLESTLGSFEIKRMASSVSPLHVEEKSNGSGHMSIKTAKVVFVLGGPGSGKGTQCALIVEHFGFTHLSAGDLLRAEINSGNENGVMIQSMIKEGKIVPSEVTVRLLQKAMLTSNNDKFLIDGFPRNDENRAAFEHVTGIKPEFILFFDCTEKEMEKRILGRNQGRVDDNIETIRKRFKVFAESSLPVISHYESFGKVWKIDADRTRDEVFESVRPLFAPFLKEIA